jgi:hypothetical protein
VLGRERRDRAEEHRLVDVERVADTRIVQFSPTGPLRETEKVLMRNMKAMQAGGE